MPVTLISDTANYETVTYACKDCNTFKNFVSHNKERDYSCKCDAPKPVTDLHAPGAKDDSAKIDWSYLIEYFPNAVRLLGVDDGYPYSNKDPLELLAIDALAGAIEKTASELQSQIDKNPGGFFVDSPFATAMASYPDALAEVCKVSMAGAKKYSRGGWRHVENGISRYTAAYMRHWISRNIEGETHSDDLGILHLSHELWNLMALAELSLEA